MGSYYSIVQYSPDKAAGEKVNIGVIVVSDSVHEMRFLKTWHRASRFSGMPKENFLVIQKDIEDSLSFVYRGSEHFGIKELSELSLESIYNVTFTEPRGSLLPASELLKFASSRFLVEGGQKDRSRGASRRRAINIGRNALSKALNAYNSLELRIVEKDNAEITGSVEHHCDYGLKNGKLKLGGFGVSLDRANSSEVESQFYSIYAIATNLKQYEEEIPLSVVIVGDKLVEANLVNRAEKLFTGFVDVLTSESQAETWAYEHVHELVKIGHSASHSKSDN